MSKKTFASIINDLNNHLAGMEDKKADREEMLSNVKTVMETLKENIQVLVESIEQKMENTEVKRPDLYDDLSYELDEVNEVLDALEQVC